MWDANIFLLQTGLQTLGFNPGSLDGEDGPKTQAARTAFLASRQPVVSGGTIAERIVEVAKTQLFIRETEGQNHGPGIEKLWSATTLTDGYRDRQPYCAAGVCWTIREAFKGIVTPFKLPTTPAAYGFDTWAEENDGKGVKAKVKPQEARAGDIVVFKQFSHVGIVIGRTDDGQLRTIEYNTDSAGGREGSGCMEKVRSLSLVRSIHRIL